MTNIRLQVVCGNKLISDILYPSIEAARTAWHNYCDDCYRNGIEPGGASIKRADLPRTWDIPVGSTLPGDNE